MPQALLFLAFLVLEVLWVHRFLTRTRPRLRDRLGEAMGVEITDSFRGAWRAAPGSGLANGFAVGVVDVILLIGATLGPLAVALVLLVLLAG